MPSNTPSLDQQLVGLLAERVALARAPRRWTAGRPGARRCRSARGRRPRPSGRTAPATRAGTRRWRRRRAGRCGRRTGTGQRRGDGRPLDAGDAAHAQQRRRHGGAGVAGRDHGRRLAVADRLGGPDQGGVLHAPDALARVGIHGDDLGRLDQREVAGEVGDVGRADEHDVDPELVAGPSRAGDDGTRATCRPRWHRSRSATSGSDSPALVGRSEAQPRNFREPDGVRF